MILLWVFSLLLTLYRVIESHFSKVKHWGLRNSEYDSGCGEGGVAGLVLSTGIAATPISWC